MKKGVLKECSCSYSKKKQDISGITPSPVTNDAVDEIKRFEFWQIFSIFVGIPVSNFPAFY